MIPTTISFVILTMNFEYVCHIGHWRDAVVCCAHINCHVTSIYLGQIEHRRCYLNICGEIFNEYLWSFIWNMQCSNDMWYCNGACQFEVLNKLGGRIAIYEIPEMVGKFHPQNTYFGLQGQMTISFQSWYILIWWIHCCQCSWFWHN